MKIVLTLANSAGPDEMLRSVAFHLGLHCEKSPVHVKFMKYMYINLLSVR